MKRYKSLSAFFMVFVTVCMWSDGSEVDNSLYATTANVSSGTGRWISFAGASTGVLEVVAGEHEVRSAGVEDYRIAIRSNGVVLLEVVDTNVVSLSFLSNIVRRLSWLQIQGFKGGGLHPLVGAPLEGLWVCRSEVEDLTPLRGMPLCVLEVPNSKVRDLTQISGLHLSSLNIRNTDVTDLTALKGMGLVDLDVGLTAITNLSVLRSMPLRHLNIFGTPVSDVSCLAELPLSSLCFSPERIKSGMDVLRTIPTLKIINWGAATEFWRKYDRGELPEGVIFFGDVFHIQSDAYRYPGGGDGGGHRELPRDRPKAPIKTGRE